MIRGSSSQPHNKKYQNATTDDTNTEKKEVRTYRQESIKDKPHAIEELEYRDEPSAKQYTLQ